MVTDRGTQKVAMMASSEGGMDIEEVAHSTPEKILKVFRITGLTKVFPIYASLEGALSAQAATSSHSDGESPRGTA